MLGSCECEPVVLIKVSLFGCQPLTLRLRKGVSPSMIKLLPIFKANFYVSGQPVLDTGIA